jgi:hypothetical protein
MSTLEMLPIVRMGYRDLSDDAFVQAFENCEIAGESFRHADHVRLAWIYVTKHGRRIAEQRFCDGLQRLASRLKVPQKYHLTLTLAWLRAVAARVEPGRTAPFDAWIAIHPGLLDRGFLHHYYSEPLLASPQARIHWVEPDRRPLEDTCILGAPLERGNGSAG